jgi:predicted Zn-dependent peptidase
MQAVTPEDVQDVVRKYFVDHRLTVAFLARAAEEGGGPG